MFCGNLSWFFCAVVSGIIITEIRSEEVRWRIGA
jgi:hypothetical protein